MKKIRERIRKGIAFLHKVEHKAFAKFAVALHLSYYGLVALEAHGNYRWVAGALLVVLLLEELTE